MNNLPQIFNANGNPWFIAKDISQAPHKGNNSWFGYVYAIEYGNHVKIGATTKPIQRFKALASQAILYADKVIGEIAISQPHTNYRENERFIHQHFNNSRVSGELFEITIEQFIKQCPSLKFEDLSSEKTQRSIQRFAKLKSFILGTPETEPSKGDEKMTLPYKETTCAGCGGTIVEGEMIWVSDIGEDEIVITHPMGDCLKKCIKPEVAYFAEESY